jgi:hypothetical protein
MCCCDPTPPHGSRVLLPQKGPPNDPASFGNLLASIDIHTARRDLSVLVKIRAAIADAEHMPVICEARLVTALGGRPALDDLSRDGVKDLQFAGRVRPRAVPVTHAYEPPLG